ncbi:MULTISPECIES: hypothetical protein [unclassified Variovorax]|uniref:hypothetical protein n=1 Tax=unclassified Variovorax TaxID=663243 RepID=UPI001315C025|nr:MULTISPECIES: hypothetical protein [unclassified Variovorax]VTU42657.1 hypothetical protein H6P1_00246 [Variovorax sp. PBL-H6]VTU43772.1 hypothetical protein SRS16P1_00657 [Variovorax sp. SRS16]VTU43840.1 hypothetical protein E5P1_00651 [Variovorax sp. PBL-E5]
MRTKINRLLLASAMTLAGASAFAQGAPLVNRVQPPTNHAPGQVSTPAQARDDFKALPPPLHSELGPRPELRAHAEKVQRGEHAHARRAKFKPTPEMHRLHAAIAESHANLAEAERTGDQAATLAMKHRLKRDHAALRAARAELKQRADAEFRHSEFRGGRPPGPDAEGRHPPPPRDGFGPPPARPAPQPAR